MTTIIELNNLNRARGRLFLPSEKKDLKFHYSDGEETEGYLLQVLTQAEDLSSSSPELESKIKDWPSEYHLGSRRANVLRGFDLEAIESALELGCGCGSITRYLGELGIRLDAVEGSEVRANLAALRCRDLPNVNVVNANFNHLNLPEIDYDAVFLIGVAEYAGRFSPGDDGDEKALIRLLRSLRKTLKPDGVIFVAIENRTGMKYVMGAHEDHYSLRYVGIHDYPEPAGIRTYTKNEWEHVIRESGFEQHEFSYPFPDYKTATVLLSDRYVRSNPYAYCHLEGVQSRDYVFPLNLGHREPLFWEAASAAQTIDAFANSFCIAMSNDARRLRDHCDFDFVHLPDFHRKREFCLITKKKRNEDLVVRQALMDTVGAGPQSGVTQVLQQERFHSGTLLSVEWSRAPLIYYDATRLDQLIRRYYEFLGKQEGQGEGITIDLIPSNIVVSGDGGYQAFDEEWRVDWPLDRDYVFFRGLLGFALRCNYALHRLSRERSLYTIRDFVLYGFQLTGNDASADMDSYVELEERFQDAVAQSRKGIHTNAILDMRINEPPPAVAFASKIYWKTADQDYSEARSVMAEAMEDAAPCELVFDLPSGANGMELLRFDPCDWDRTEGVGFLRIHEITVFLGSDEAWESVWRARGGAEIADRGELTDMIFERGKLGEIFAVVDKDPHIEFAFVPRMEPIPEQRYRVRVTLRVHRSTEYELVRDRFLIQEEIYKQRLQHLESELAQKEAIEQELELIKGSRTWRLAETYRRLLYVRALPRLRHLKHAVFAYFGKPDTPVDSSTPYEQWLRKQEVLRGESMDKRLSALASKPLISVIMPVYNVDPEILARAVRSVETQSYPNWELCIADDCSTNPETRNYLQRLRDPRIKVRYLERNVNIAAASNEAASMAAGACLGFLDNDDELTEHALLESVVRMEETGAELVYSDEDFIKTDGHLDFPHFKPEYSPDLLLSHNYITHFLVLRRDLFERVGGFRPGFDGAQDYDLVLRAVEHTDRIAHVTQPLYHWRMSQNSTSLNPDVKPEAHANARKAIEEALGRRRIDGRVDNGNLPHFFRVRRSLLERPLVSIVIPFKDKPGLLRRCVETILENSTYRNYEVLGISNDTTSLKTYEVMSELENADERVRFVEHNIAFNFSALVNFGVSRSRGGHVVLLNNDIEILTGDWLESLLEHSQRQEVAAVGGKLYYPNNTIQHAGIAVALGGSAGHMHKHFPAVAKGYCNRLHLIQNVTAVTGAMLMIEKALYEQLGGFDEHSFAVAYNDVDFCLRAMEKNYLNVFTPCVEAYHYESVSRGYEDTPEKLERFKAERENLIARHAAILNNGDPYYSPNFDQGRDDFSLRPL